MNASKKIFKLLENDLKKIGKNFLSCTICVKSVRIWSFSGPYFLAFELNKKRYSVSLRIKSKYWKIQTRKTDR